MLKYFLITIFAIASPFLLVATIFVLIFVLLAVWSNSGHQEQYIKDYYQSEPLFIELADLVCPIGGNVLEINALPEDIENPRVRAIMQEIDLGRINVKSEKSHCTITIVRKAFVSKHVAFKFVGSGSLKNGSSGSGVHY